MVKWRVGSAVERHWVKKNGTSVWFVAEVIGVRSVAPEGCIRKRREVLVHFLNEKTEKNDAWLPVVSSELRESKQYLDTFEDHTGHLEDDQWLVERIVAERGVGKSKEYEVKWEGWGRRGQHVATAVHHIGDYHIAEWEARVAAAADAATRFQSEEARFWAREHAQTPIRILADTLVDKLERAPDRAARRMLFQCPCDEWLFSAFFEHLAEGLPASELNEYVTPPKQTVGVRGTTEAVAYDFHIVSAALVTTLLSLAQQRPRRSGHVYLGDTTPATAVALLTPVTFTRRGLRDEPHKMKLTVTAGFGALAARNGDNLPDWRFDDRVSLTGTGTRHACSCRKRSPRWRSARRGSSQRRCLSSELEMRGGRLRAARVCHGVWACRKRSLRWHRAHAGARPSVDACLRRREGWGDRQSRTRMFVYIVPSVYQTPAAKRKSNVTRNPITVIRPDRNPVRKDARNAGVYASPDRGTHMYITWIYTHPCRLFMPPSTSPYSMHR